MLSLWRAGVAVGRGGGGGGGEKRKGEKGKGWGGAVVLRGGGGLSVHTYLRRASVIAKNCGCTIRPKA